MVVGPADDRSCSPAGRLQQGPGGTPGRSASGGGGPQGPAILPVLWTDRWHVLGVSLVLQLRGELGDDRTERLFVCEHNTILSNYIRASSGSCAIDANYCRLLRGSTVGSWGPWYYIWPNWGPSITVRKGIKIRVKNLASPPANAYNQGIYYDAPTNTWTVASAIASGNFDIQVTTPGGLTLCPPRE